MENATPRGQVSKNRSCLVHGSVTLLLIHTQVRTNNSHHVIIIIIDWGVYFDCYCTTTWFDPNYNLSCAMMKSNRAARLGLLVVISCGRVTISGHAWLVAGDAWLFSSCLCRLYCCCQSANNAAIPLTPRMSLMAVTRIQPTAVVTEQGQHEHTCTRPTILQN